MKRSHRATEHITGFYEHAHHPLTVEAALRFGEAIHSFKEGRALIGYSPEARLVVPVYETAFALSRLLEDRGEPWTGADHHCEPGTNGRRTRCVREGICATH